MILILENEFNLNKLFLFYANTLMKIMYLKYLLKLYQSKSPPISISSSATSSFFSSFFSSFLVSFFLSSAVLTPEVVFKTGAESELPP